MKKLTYVHMTQDYSVEVEEQEIITMLLREEYTMAITLYYEEEEERMFLYSHLTDREGGRLGMSLGEASDILVFLYNFAGQRGVTITTNMWACWDRVNSKLRGSGSRGGKMIGSEVDDEFIPPF